MYSYLVPTGKKINPYSDMRHGIKCTVNDTTISFTVADNEKCSFGLFDRNNKLIGYLDRRNLTSNYPKCAAINGRFDIVVRDAPNGTTVRKIESFYLNSFGGVTKHLH